MRSCRGSHFDNCPAYPYNWACGQHIEVCAITQGGKCVHAVKAIHIEQMSGLKPEALKREIRKVMFAYPMPKNRLFYILIACLLSCGQHVLFFHLLLSVFVLLCGFDVFLVMKFSFSNRSVFMWYPQTFRGS